MVKKYFRFFAMLFSVLALLLISACSAVAAEQAPPIEWALEEISGSYVFSPRYDEKYEALTVRAVVNYHRQHGQMGGVFVVIPDVITVLEDAGLTRIFAYATSCNFHVGEDGIYRWSMKLTGPYEICAVADESSGVTETFCGTPLPPRKVSPETWETFKLEEASFDPSSFLKENIVEKASPETSRRVLAFLDREKDFLDRGWEKVVGKPIAVSKAGEISAALKTQMLKTQNLYHEAIKQYNLLGKGELSEEPFYEDINAS